MDATSTYPTTREKMEDKKKKPKPKKTKELQLNPSIQEHDLNVKINHAKDWIDKKCRIRISMSFRGRENQHKEAGLAKFKTVVDALLAHGAVVGSAQKQDGNQVSIIVDSKGNRT